MESRPRRRKTNSLLGSGEYVLDIDKEILQMEQNPLITESDPQPILGRKHAVNGLMMTQERDVVHHNDNTKNNKSVVDVKKRKRGRPRKHPVVVEMTPGIKRPRGRPRGSGKHQRAGATPPVHDGMVPHTLPQTRDVPVSIGDATPDCSESTPIANRPPQVGMVTPPPRISSSSSSMVTPKQEGMGLRSSSGKNRRKGSLPTKTEL
jgi:hypothetical protein